MKIKRKYHGKSNTKLYAIWRAIKKRCYLISELQYKDYGGRGITMQADWVNNFPLFESYVTSLDGYDEKKIGRKGLSIDRVDNDGNYEEGNLRWADICTQNRNRRKPQRNTSGFIGVTFYKDNKKYVARISVNCKQKYLGSRETAQEAYQLRVDYILKNQLEGFEIKLP